MAKIVLREGINFRSGKSDSEDEFRVSYHNADHFLKSFAPNSYKKHNLKGMHQAFHASKLNRSGYINRKVAKDVADEVEKSIPTLHPESPWEKEHLEKFVKIMRSPKAYQD